MPDNSPLQVKLDQLNDTLVLVYIETDIIPLLTEVSRGDVINSNVIADTIIRFRFASLRRKTGSNHILVKIC